jgi:alpha-L-fucosidase
VWFDTPRRIERAQSESLLKLVHDLQPACLVNGRLGNGLGDYGEAGDNRYPDQLLEQDWEVPATINDTWGFKSDDHNWKSPGDLVRKLVDVSSKGGVYLLNVGPTAEGVIPAPSVDRLLEVGAWLGVNGESVYGTRPGPVQGLDWCRSTRKPGRVYLHVLEWPHGGTIRVDGLGQRVTGAWLLADPVRTPLSVASSPDGVTVAGPASAPDAIDSVVVLETE